jgi:uncharacterized membrane protein
MTRWLAVSILLTAGAFAASAYVYFFQYDSLPEQIAVHWNIRGEPDHIVPKSEAWSNFWLCPLVMVLMVVLTVVLPWISPRHNSRLSASVPRGSMSWPSWSHCLHLSIWPFCTGRPGNRRSSGKSGSG